VQAVGSSLLLVRRISGALSLSLPPTMSLRQAMKRSLVASRGSDVSGGKEGGAVPPAAKRARTVKKSTTTARHLAAEDLPRIELEEGGDEDDEDFANDDDIGAAEESDGENEQQEAALKPLKKRFSTVKAESDAPPMLKPGKSYSASNTAAQPDAQEVDLEVDIGDFDDGYDSDLMGDEEDRERLTKLSEIEREKELARRYEQRLIGKQNVDLRRQLQHGERSRHGPSYKPATEARKAPAKASLSSDEEVSADEEEEQPKRRVATKVVAGRGRGRGRGGKAASRKQLASPKSSSSVASESDSAAESEDSSASSASEESVEQPTSSRKKRETEAERKYRLYGSDSEGEADAMNGEDGEAPKRNRKGRDVDVSLKAIKGAHRGAGGRTNANGASSVNIDLYLSDSDGDEFDDEADRIRQDLPAGMTISDSAEPTLADSSEVPFEYLLKHAFLRKRQILAAMDKPYFRDLVQGSFVRVVQPPAEGVAAVPGKNYYRVAKVVDYVNLPRPYDPWYGTPHLKAHENSPVDKTNMALHIAIGSSAMQAGSSTTKRVVEFFRVSDSFPTLLEWQEYCRRCKEQYRTTHSQEDAPTTVGEIRRMFATKKLLKDQASFTPTLVDKSIKLREEFMFTDAKLRKLPNLAYIRDAMSLRLDECSKRLREYSADSQEHKLLTSEIGKLRNRLNAVNREEAKRRVAFREKEKEKLETRKDVSSLTRLINSKVEKHNREVLELAAHANRAKISDPAAAAANEDNPFMRRRTAPEILWKVAAQAADVAAVTAAVAPQAASTENPIGPVDDTPDVVPASLEAVLGPESEGYLDTLAHPQVQEPLVAQPAKPSLSFEAARRLLGLTA
jgi:hypothetical protein